ncbi:MAG: insulinase family protein [Alphaproteobacteria bacterium]|nr:insulinase family protein [Alphaproteobacteria bacterium]
MNFKKIWLAALVISACLAWQLISAAAQARPWVHPESFTLSNGLQVVVLPDHRAPVVTHMLWYRVGSADEMPGKSGIAHFLEHLMFKGTGKIPPGEFSKIVARLGGQDNAFTSYDFTTYFQRVALDKLPQVMEMEADRMVNLRLTDKVVLPERDVILEERNSRTDNNPAALFSEQIEAAQFLSHPYGRPVIGWRREMETLTTQDALAHYRKHYGPDNAYLIVAGDIDAATLRPLAEKYYGGLAPHGIPERVRPQEPPQLAARRLEMTDDRVVEPSWQRSYLAPSHNKPGEGDPDALQVFSQILGGGASSRLYRNLIIDKPVATSAAASYEGIALDYGQFYLHAAPRKGQTVAVLEQEIEKILAQIMKDGVTAEEVDRAKRQMVASAVYAQDSQESMAQIFGNVLATGRSVDDIIAWPDRIQTVTPERVNAAAKFILRPENSVTGILLPGKKSPGKKS